MNNSDILSGFKTLEKKSLNQLQSGLEFEKYGWVLGAGIVFVPYNIVLMGLLIIAVVFTPFMLWHLYKAKWYKSISVFIVTVILPFIGYQFFNTGHFVADFLLMVFPLFTFFCYTWILSYVIRDYLNELEATKSSFG